MSFRLFDTTKPNEIIRIHDQTRSVRDAKNLLLPNHPFYELVAYLHERCFSNQDFIDKYVNCIRPKPSNDPITENEQQTLKEALTNSFPKIRLTHGKPSNYGYHIRKAKIHQNDIFLNAEYAHRFKNVDLPVNLHYLAALTITIFHEVAHYLVTRIFGPDKISHVNLDYGDSYPDKKGGESGYYMEAKIFGGIPQFIREKKGDRYMIHGLVLQDQNRSYDKLVTESSFLQIFDSDFLVPLNMGDLSPFENKPDSNYELARSVSLTAIHGEGGFQGYEVGIDQDEFEIATRFETSDVM